jgi:hypothetical protein
VRAAEVAEQASLYDDAARAWEAAARACSMRPTECSVFYLAAAGNWDLAREAGDAWRCRQESARLRQAPLLQLESQTQPRCNLGDYVMLSIQLKNVGYGTAQRVKLHVGGSVQQLQQVDVGSIRQGAAKQLEVEVNPSKSGHIRATMWAIYQDRGGEVQEPAQGALSLLVERPPTVEKHYHAPVFEIAQDGVIIYRGAGAEGAPRITAAGDTALVERGSKGSSVGVRSGDDEVHTQSADAEGGAQCPHCGQGVAASDRHCSYCGQAL